MTASEPRGLAAIDPRYRAIYERAVTVLGDDARVADVAASGSVRDGTADRWSDLDLEVVAHAEDHASLLEDWPVWLAEITPTVFRAHPDRAVHRQRDHGRGAHARPGRVRRSRTRVAAAEGADVHRRHVGETVHGPRRRARVRGRRTTTRHGRPLHQPRAARGTHASPRRRPAPPRTPHDGLPRRDGRTTAGQALEPHLHRGTARRGRRPATRGRGRETRSSRSGSGSPNCS